MKDVRIRVLMVDDDENKCAAVSELIEDAGLAQTVDLVQAGSVTEARGLLTSEKFPLALIDMALPLVAGGAVSSDGGAKLLADLSRKRGVIAPSHVLGMTARPDLLEAATRAFGGSGISVVFFDLQTTAWQRPLLARVRHAVREQELFGDVPEFRTDFGVVCALSAPELDAILKLPISWRQDARPGDDSIYFVGSDESAGAARQWVAVAASNPGMTHAATAAMKLIAAYRPKYLVMTGICAGVARETGVGDVIAMDPCWDWGSGKFEGSGSSVEFKLEPMQHRLCPRIKAILRNMARDEMFLHSIYSSWPGPKPPNLPRLRIGPCATGASVVASEAKLAEVVAQNRKLLALEMEGFGVFTACAEASRPRPECVVLKAVVDFATEEKSDAFQGLGAVLSAGVALELSRRL